MKVWQIFREELEPVSTHSEVEPFKSRFSRASRAALRQLSLSTGIRASAIDLSDDDYVSSSIFNWYEDFIGKRLLAKGKFDKALGIIKTKLDKGSLKYDSLFCLADEIVKYSPDSKSLIDNFEKAKQILEYDLSFDALVYLCKEGQDHARRLKLARDYIASLNQDQIMKFLTCREYMFSSTSEIEPDSVTFISPDIPGRLLEKITDNEKIRELCLRMHNDIDTNKNIATLYKQAIAKYSKSCAMDSETLEAKISRASDLLAIADMRWHKTGEELHRQIDGEIESEHDEFVIDIAAAWELLIIKSKLPDTLKRIKREPNERHKEKAVIANNSFIYNFDTNLYILTQLINRTSDLSVIGELEEFVQSNVEGLIESSQARSGEIFQALIGRRQYLSGK